MERKRKNAKVEKSTWTFLSNHAHVLICIARNPSSRVRDLAALVGITERAVHRLIAELKEAGYLQYDREGRRNRYTVCGDLAMRHAVEGHCLVSDLLETVLQPGTRSMQARATRRTR